MRRFLVIFGLLFALQSCAERGTITIAPDPGGVGTVETIFVVTSRGKDPATQILSGVRSANDSYGRYDVSIPPNREVGEINWPTPGEPADPTQDFVTTEAVQYPDAANFRSALRGALQSNTVQPGAAIIFVHGFNTNFSEGLYRLAQISHDLEIEGTVVHYSWPSAASPLAYLYDHDSAIFARDGLEETINDVAAAGATRITLVAHSMGSYLTMETLRQMAIRDSAGMLVNVDGVVLISPDIDVDVFVSQAEAIGEMPDPFFIFTSQEDKALGLSARLSADDQRLGSLEDVSRLGDLDVTLLDVTAYSEGSGHFNAATSPELVALLNKVRDLSGFYDADQGAGIGLLEGAVLTVRNATQVVVPALPGMEQ